MPKCEKCPNPATEGQTLCRYHRNEKQMGRVEKVEWILKKGPVIVAVLTMIVKAVISKGRVRA